MASLATVRGGLYSRLSTTLTTANVYRYELAGLNRPAVIVGFPDRFTQDTFGNVTRDFTIPVRCEEVATKDWATAEAALEVLVEAVITAIQADTSLGSTVDDCAIVDISGYGFRTVTESLTVLMCEVNVGVMA